MTGICLVNSSAWVESDGPASDQEIVSRLAALVAGLPEKHTAELFEMKCGVLFQHVLEKHPDSEESVYFDRIS